MQTMKTGRYIGVGVGPGDPQLITLKAIKAIEKCALLIYPANLKGVSMARDIAQQHIGKDTPEHAIELDFSTDRKQAEQAYDQAEKAIVATLEQGLDVAILCLGDPLFYGSFIYLHQRLQTSYEAIVIPGITAASAASALAQLPLTLQRDSYCVQPAPRDKQAELKLSTALKTHDCVVIMKAGRQRARIVELIKQSGRGAQAVYIEQAGLPAEKIIDNIGDLKPDPGDYFSLFIISKYHR